MGRPGTGLPLYRAALFSSAPLSPPRAMQKREATSVTDQDQNQEVISTDPTENKVTPTVDNSAIIVRITLTNGMVLQVGKPWPGPNGKPDPSAIYKDKDGNDIPLKIGAIFLRAEETEMVEETEEDDSVITRTLTTAGCYEVWSEPAEPMRMFRVSIAQTVIDEQTVPFKHGRDVVNDRVADSVVLDDGDEEETESVAASETMDTVQAPPPPPSPPNGAASSTPTG